MTRSQRNKNPGNIDRGHIPWLGEDRSEEALASEHRFCVFLAPEYGYRALGKLLLTYQDRYGLHTVRNLINRWAPPAENDTGAYVNAVAGAIHTDPDAGLDLTHPGVLAGIVKAIAHHEAGLDPFPDSDLEAGMHLLGVA